MNRQIDHKAMRAVVGIIALLLAPAVYFLSDTQEPFVSISMSYWTSSGDVFVGSLIAIGFFLFAYNGAGNGRDLEFYLSKAACVFAILVALFPTQSFRIDEAAPTWAGSVSNAVGLQPTQIHYAAAGLLFICLITMMWFFSKRAKSKGRLIRANTYRVISVLMVVGIAALYAYGTLTGSDYTTLIVEAWGLTLFGIGWLIAGSYKTEPDLDRT